MTKITPLAGKALIQLEPLWKDRTTFIFPDSVKNRKNTIGLVIAITPPMDARPEVFAAALALKGKRVLVTPYSGAQQFSYNGMDGLVIVPIDDIEAYVDGNEAVVSQDGPSLRCKWCGPAKGEVSTNAPFLVDSPNGPYCIRCGRGLNGEMVDHEEVKVSDGTVAMVQDKMDRAKEAEMRRNGIEPTRKIISTG